MANQKLPQFLTDAPITQLMNWIRYDAKTDKTMLPPTVIVDPAQNCLVPNGDKALPRQGSQIKFQGANPPLNVGSIGKNTKFKNFFGVEMDVKAYRATLVGEQVLVLFNNEYVPITITPNLSLNGEDKIYFTTYTDSTLDLNQEKRIPRLLWVNGYEHTDGTGRVFSWTGGITNIATIAANVITCPVGLTWRQLGFTTWFPTTTEIHVTINGVEYFSTNGLATLAYNTLVGTFTVGEKVTDTTSGAHAKIVADSGTVLTLENVVGVFTSGDSLLGDISGATATAGTYTPSELDTDTLTLNASPTAVAGDVVSASVEVDTLVASMDHVKQNKNYAYYGNFNIRQWWMSNQFGRPSTTRLTSSNATQDDLVIDGLTNYTGTGAHTYKLLITSVTPATEDRIYNGTGPNNSNWVYDPITYAGSGTNNYRIVIAADVIVTFAGGVTPAFQTGEIIVGNVDGTRFKVVDLTGAGAIYVQYISGNMANGQTFTGLASGTTSPNMVASKFQNGAFPYRNGVLVTGIDGSQLPSGLLQFSVAGNQFSNPAGIDNLNFNITQIGQGEIGDEWIFEVQKQQPDKFTWQKDNEPVQGPFNLESDPQNPFEIEDGILVYWVSKFDHSIGDYWIIQVNQTIIRPWANFYYTLDVTSQNSLRRPGEGWVYTLPSTFWTSDTFEDSIYINTWNGDWGYTTPTLSADLLSEDITLTPLKQVVSSRALYPYLTGHNRNDLIYIDENKNLISMGRKVLMEKVQSYTMTDDVLNKFQQLSWTDGSIIYQDNSINLTSPNENTMMVFNERRQYWQPPQIIPNLGLLTIIDTDLYVHSYLDTGTRKLNDPDAIGDDGSEYEVILRNSTYDHGNRWMKKEANMAFLEGRIFKELPPGVMKLAVYFDPEGCSGISEEEVVPKFCCDDTNNGNIGGSNEGHHEIGGDVTHRCDYFRYQMIKLQAPAFYFSSMEFRCRTTVHKYEILSMGINLMESKFNNKEGRPPANLDDLLPLNAPNP